MIKYLSVFLCFLVFNRIEKVVLPYSVAIFVCALYSGCSPFFTPILFLSALLLSGATGLLGSLSICAVFLSLVFLIYRKTNYKPFFELVAYTAISLFGFIFIGNTSLQISVEKRILFSIFAVVLTLICLVADKAVSEKGLKFKFGFEEYCALSIFIAVFGLGVSNLITPYIWKGVSIFLLLLACFLFRTGSSTLLSSVLGISLAIYYNDLNYVAVFLVLNVVSSSLTEFSRYAAAVGTVACDYVVQAVFNVYPTYGLLEFFSVFIGALIFCMIPNKPIKKLKEKLYSFRERQLVRQSINRNRLMLSNRLYEISGVFTEMANAFNLFKKNNLTEDKVKPTIIKQTISSVCKECQNYLKCKKNEKNVNLGLNKMVDIGFAKGKLSLIDMPKEVTDNCMHPGGLIFGINKLLASYRTYKLENANINTGRDMLAAEAQGVAEILRGLATESGALLKYQSRLERMLSESLFKNGFSVSELLIYGEEERFSVGMIITMKEFSLSKLLAVASKTLGVEMCLNEKADVTEDKCYLSLVKATEFDAVFGVASAKKDNSIISGDTHSVARLSGDKFLIALSDGMGSGEYAENVSSASLSLIESFYKAGLASPLILNTVNKLLSVNTEDSFTALDVSIIDLKNCTADFIKYGCPYGFIINDNGIKIIEGNSLPLGIIEELKPSVCHAELECGDMLMLFTDGVSDAFGSSGEVIDFLRSVPAKNPQSLADSVLEKAIKINGGQKKDDMTVLTVRIFKRLKSA